MFPRFQLPSALALAAALIGPGIAWSTPAAAQISALTRPEDSGLSCKAIATEMNDLAEARSQTAKRAAGGRKLFGFATSALQVAAPVLGSSGLGGSAIGAAAAQVAMTAAQTQATVAANPAPAEAASSASPEAQRMQKLGALYADKGC